MTKSKATKKALLGSVVALLLCFTMLMGATFAWFTDNVSSTGNRIQAGDLEVDLVMDKLDGAGYVSIADGKGDIFSEATGNGINWEPGKTEVVYLGVRNNGSLALKYNILLNIVDGNTSIVGAPGLIGSLEFAIIDGATSADVFANWDEVKAASNGQTGDIVAGQIVAAQGGVLDEIALSNEEFETDYFALAVHMKEEAGNEYENGAITIDLLVNATQKDAEVDSFGNGYDMGAEFEEVAVGTVYENATNPTTLSSKNVAISVPVGAPAGEYRLDVTDMKKETVGDETTLSLDINLSLEGQKVNDATVNYPVEVIVGPLLNITEVTHNGAAVVNYSYNPTSGIISFNTNSFSPFAISYTTAADGAEFAGDKLIAGTFRGLNPAEVDASIAEEGSDYIAVNYTKNGETYYEVVKRGGKTVVVADAESDVSSQTNGNFTFTKLSSDNALYSIFSGLQSEEFSTVYILPGTYNCGTTLNILSSMDIIGIGDKENVVIKKVGVNDQTTIYAYNKGPSNRHLFNCNGSKAEYIQVTLRNLTLDASEPNRYKKYQMKNSTKVVDATQDNAAVQSIRRTKVKCYDLDVIKEENSNSSIAFYANGTNTVTGESTASAGYMYVENCSVNNANQLGVFDRQPGGSSRIYYNNVTYNNGQSEYTYTSTYIKNIAMDANNWEW